MRLCVLDCSLTMAWVFDDEADASSDALLKRMRDGDSVVVPAVLWSLEVANCLDQARRRRRLTTRQVEEKRRFLEMLPVIELIPPHGLGESAFELGCRLGLTAYDAAYLALAIEERLT